MSHKTLTHHNKRTNNTPNEASVQQTEEEEQGVSRSVGWLGGSVGRCQEASRAVREYEAISGGPRGLSEYQELWSDCRWAPSRSDLDNASFIVLQSFSGGGGAEKEREREGDRDKAEGKEGKKPERK